VKVEEMEGKRLDSTGTALRGKLSLVSCLVLCPLI